MTVPKSGEISVLTLNRTKVNGTTYPIPLMFPSFSLPPTRQQLDMSVWPPSCTLLMVDSSAYLFSLHSGGRWNVSFEHLHNRYTFTTDTPSMKDSSVQRQNNDTED